MREGIGRRGKWWEGFNIPSRTSERTTDMLCRQ
jgi:hypothetical protein